MLQNAKQRGIPRSCYVLPVVEPAAVGHKRTWLCSHYVLQLNNTGLILSSWEGSLAEQKALSSWLYRWERGREAPGSSHMLTQLLVKGVNSKGFFCHPRTQGTVNIYSVVGQPEDQSHFSLISL